MADPSDPLEIRVFDEPQTQAPFWADLAFKWSGCAAFLAGAAAAIKIPPRVRPCRILDLK